MLIQTLKMKQPLNNKNNSKWLAIGLLMIVISFVAIVFILPVVSMGLEGVEKKEKLIFELKRYKKKLAQENVLRKNLELIEKKYQEQPYFYNNGSTAVVSNKLKSFIEEVVEESGGTIQSFGVAQNKSEGGYMSIIVKPNMTVSMEVLRDVLYQLETATPLIIINELSIEPLRKRRRRKMVSNGQLNVNFDAISFMETE